MRLDEGNRGQKPLSLQSIPVQILRRNVRGGDERHAMAEQPLEQAGQDHGIGDVRDEELVQAQHAHALGDAPRDCFEGTRTALDAAELFVHVAHESIEVRPLARHGAQ